MGNNMPKLECVCGEHVFNLSKIPSPNEFNLVPESAMEQVISALGRSDQIGKEVLELLDKKSRMVLICPICKRIYLEEVDSPGRYVRYRIEELSKNNIS